MKCDPNIRVRFDFLSSRWRHWFHAKRMQMSPKCRINRLSTLRLKCHKPKYYFIELCLWIRPNKNVPLRFIIHGVPVAIKLQRCIRLLSPVGCCRLSQRDQSFGKLVEITNISLQLAAKCLHNQRLFLAPNWNSTWKKFEKFLKNHFQILKIIPTILAIFKWIFFQLICICKWGDIPQKSGKIRKNQEKSTLIITEF